MTLFLKFAAIPAALALAACSASETPDSTPTRAPVKDQANSAGDTRPVGEPSLVTVEGRIREGVECLSLATPEGDSWSFNTGEADFAVGDYVRITGEVADASYCQRGRGTLIPRTIEAIDPPARDRDPARAGGLAVTSDYVRGAWVAKGVEADCSRPDFQITSNRNGGSIIETSVDGVPATGYVDVGETPALQWDEGIPTLPIETRGPDGLAVMPGEGRIVTMAGQRIAGDGVVFVKCA